MSRGLGKIQKQILEALEYYRANPNFLTRIKLGTSGVRIPRKPHYLDFIGYIWGEGFREDKSKLVSISRAITSLEKGGLVKKGLCGCDELYPSDNLQRHRTVELVKC